jgi:hypothetical protein
VLRSCIGESIAAYSGEESSGLETLVTIVAFIVILVTAGIAFDAARWK